MKINFMYSKREIISAMNQNLNLKELIFSVLIAAALLVYGIFQLMSGSTRIFDVFIFLISILFFLLFLSELLLFQELYLKDNPISKKSMLYRLMKRTSFSMLEILTRQFLGITIKR
ncbi:hypothetical protein [Paenibacillus albus]|uniref:hypothetical protein n=1 Tax=Paenibacillus albus TaxID=2495582 RepID=UPI001D131018|nr:hypothetical protein [Paenibacillus albus]